METGDVKVGIAQLQLFQDVVAHLLGRARREAGNRQIRKACAQPAQLAVVRPELVSPFRNAVCFVYREESYWNPAQPVESVLPGQALGRQIQQPVIAALRADHDATMLR